MPGGAQPRIYTDCAGWRRLGLQPVTIRVSSVQICGSLIQGVNFYDPDAGCSANTPDYRGVVGRRESSHNS